MRGFETDSPFCANPDCELHVWANTPGVMGRGNWARMRDGRIIGRSTYGGVFLCDACLREWCAVLAFFPEHEFGIRLDSSHPG
jgi:hypothetical protein